MHFADWFLRSFRKNAPRFSCRFLSISSTSEKFGQNSCRIRAESVSKFVRRGRVGGAKKSVRCGPGEWGGTHVLIHVRGASGSAGNWGGGGVQGSGGEHVREGGQEFGGEREQSDPPISAVCVCGGRIQTSGKDVFAMASGICLWFDGFLIRWQSSCLLRTHS